MFIIDLDILAAWLNRWGVFCCCCFVLFVGCSFFHLPFLHISTHIQSDKFYIINSSVNNSMSSSRSREEKGHYYRLDDSLYNTLILFKIAWWSEWSSGERLVILLWSSVRVKPPLWSSASVFSLLSAFGVCMYLDANPVDSCLCCHRPWPPSTPTASNPPAWHTEMTPHLPYVAI